MNENTLNRWVAEIVRELDRASPLEERGQLQGFRQKTGELLDKDYGQKFAGSVVARAYEESEIEDYENIVKGLVATHFSDNSSVDRFKEGWNEYQR